MSITAVPALRRPAAMVFCLFQSIQLLEARGDTALVDPRLCYFLAATDLPVRSKSGGLFEAIPHSRGME